MDNIIFGIIIGFILISMTLFFCVILIRVYFTKIKKDINKIKDIDIDKSTKYNEFIKEFIDEKITPELESIISPLLLTHDYNELLYSIITIKSIL